MFLLSSHFRFLKQRTILRKLLTTSFSTKASAPIIENFFRYSNNTAVIDDLGPHKYKDILYSSYLIAKEIESSVANDGETNKRISFLCSNDSTYVSVLLACWISGNIAVPLCSKHPDSLLEYFIYNSQSSLAIASDNFSGKIQTIASKLNVKFLKVVPVVKNCVENLNIFKESKNFSCNFDLSNENALIIYTSGSTGLPKGVVLTHDNLNAQVSSLVKAWEVTSEDCILHTLPLHHMHGIMNALLCLINVGGTVVMRPSFKASEAWNYLTNQNSAHPQVNLFYGVPTMYISLIDELQSFSNAKHVRKYCEKNIRLMTCGSAALPETVFHKWKDITGHFLLERYGMSEVGMALSNPFRGSRIPGSVGLPLPGVDIKIIEDSFSSESTTLVQSNNTYVETFQDSDKKSGELLIKGSTVFKEYWNNKKATHEAFTKSGWFKTGDTATYCDGSFKILGRTAVDIIKSGGYKISALQVESCLLLHPNIKDCAVFGIPDEKWGESITALLITKDERAIDDSDLKSWCKNFLPAYSIPTVVKYIENIPRNVMGKVNKKELKKSFI